MKYLAAIAICLLATSAQAQKLSDDDKGFIVVTTATMLMSTKCNVKVVPGGAIRFGDKMGIDGEKLLKANIAALKVQADMPYEHEDLIPGVMQATTMTYNSLLIDLDRDKSTTCSKWTKMLKGYGMLE